MNIARTFLFSGALLAGLAAFNCGGAALDESTDPAAPADDSPSTSEAELASSKVGMTAHAFTPAALSVKVGTAVTFTNTSPVAHTVTSGKSSAAVDGPGALFDKVVARGGKFTFKFTQPGVFPYFCRPHEGMGMKGTITVVP